MKTRFSLLITKGLLLILFIFSIHNLIYTQVTPGSVVEEEIDPYLATPSANYMEEMPVVIVRYLPTLDGINIDVAQATDFWELGYITIDELKNNIDIYDKRVKFSLEEGSKFHGYSEDDAVPFLGYKVIKYLSVYRQIAISDFPHGNNNEYQPDYNKEFEDLNLTEFITNNNVKEVWLWHGDAARPGWPSYDPEIHGHITEWIIGPESNMSSPTTGDISNSYRYPDDIPIVDHTFVVYCYNFRRTQAEAVHNHGHQLECMHNYTAIQQDGTNSMFLEKFCGWGPNYTVPPIGRAGDTHHPPNTNVDYDYYNTTFVESDIQDWNPLGGPVTLVNCNTWGDIDYNWPGISEVFQKIENQWYIYWFQNMPGYNNKIPYDSYVMRNWWQFVSDWDSCYINNIGLYGFGLGLQKNTVQLSKVYPNPFTTSTTIEYTLTHPQTVTIKFYNQFGKQVDRIELKQPAGVQQITWNAIGQPAGIYYFILNAGLQSANGKMVLIR